MNFFGSLNQSLCCCFKTLRRFVQPSCLLGNSTQVSPLELFRKNLDLMGCCVFFRNIAICSSSVQSGKGLIVRALERPGQRLYPGVIR